MNKQKRTAAIVLGVLVLFLVALVVFMLISAGRSDGEETAPPAPTSTQVPPTSTTAQDADAAIQNIIWQWTLLKDQGAVTTVPNPGSYTLIFYPVETFSGTADCNSISGTYSSRNGFSVKVQTSTMAYCGENSLDTLYLSILEDVVAGGPDGAGGFALETAGGAQRMEFKNGGTAP